MAAAIRELTSLDQLEKEWDILENDIAALKQNEYQKVLNSLDEYRSAQEKLKKGLTQNLLKVGGFNHAIKRLSKTDENTNPIKWTNFTSRINSMGKKFSEMQQGLPRQPGWFLKACLGPINCSLYWDKLAYKNAYEQFKFRVTIFSVIFSLVNTFFLNYRFSDVLFHALMVWYYSSLTLQEHILIANGSRIKGWWVLHHYLSILVSGFLLIWPSGVGYQLFRKQFYYFSLYLSFVQLLQYHYQKGVLYRLRALGVSTAMDTTGEGFKSWMFRGLGFLLPFLVIGYAYQIFNAYTLLQISLRPDCSEWQIPALSGLFLLLGCGNAITLIFVVRQKSSIVPRFPCG